MADNTLKDFLIRLGYKVDETDEKKFVKSVEAMTSKVIALGAIIEGVAIAGATGFINIAKNLETLYFQSKRTGSSAADIRSFGEAMERIGLDGDEARQSLVQLGDKVRDFSGMASVFSQWGINVHKANGEMKGSVEVATELARHLHNLYNSGKPEDRALAVVQGRFAGFSEQEIRQMAMFTDEYIAAITKLKETNKGLTDAQAEDAHGFMNSLREVSNEFTAVWTNIEGVISKFIEGTIGWKPAIIGFAVALGSLTAITGFLTIAKGLSAIGGSLSFLTGAGEMALGIVAISAAVVGMAAALDSLFTAQTKHKGMKWGRGGWIPDKDYKEPVVAPQDTAHIGMRFHGGRGGHGYWEKDPNYKAPETSQQTNATGTLGERNNNPGNLEYAGQAGATSDGRFAKFGNAQQGLDAMAKQLQRYAKQGYDSIYSIIKRYSPDKENPHNNEEIASIAKQMGQDAYTHLNLQDPTVLANLMNSMIKAENGRNVYSQDMISKAAGSSVTAPAVNQTNNVTIHGANDPGATASKVGLTLNSVNENLIRNMRPRVIA